MPTSNKKKTQQDKNKSIGNNIKNTNDNSNNITMPVRAMMITTTPNGQQQVIIQPTDERLSDHGAASSPGRDSRGSLLSSQQQGLAPGSMMDVPGTAPRYAIAAASSSSQQLLSHREAASSYPFMNVQLQPQIMLPAQPVPMSASGPRRLLAMSTSGPVEIILDGGGGGGGGAALGGGIDQSSSSSSLFASQQQQQPPRPAVLSGSAALMDATGVVPGPGSMQPQYMVRLPVSMYGDASGSSGTQAMMDPQQQQQIMVSDAMGRPMRVPVQMVTHLGQSGGSEGMTTSGLLSQQFRSTPASAPSSHPNNYNLQDILMENQHLRQQNALLQQQVMQLMRQLNQGRLQREANVQPMMMMRLEAAPPRFGPSENSERSEAVSNAPPSSAVIRSNASRQMPADQGAADDNSSPSYEEQEEKKKEAVANDEKRGESGRPPSPSESTVSSSNLEETENPFKRKTKGSRERDLDRPKRPMTAYNFFFKEERARMIGELAEDEIMDSAAVAEQDAEDNHITPQRKKRRRKPHRKIGFEDMAKQISQKWKTVDKESWERYEVLAKQEKARYEKEKAIYLRLKRKRGKNSSWE